MLFIRIACLLLALPGTHFAQNVIKANGGTISVANHEWGQGTFKHYVGPKEIDTRDGKHTVPAGSRTLHGYLYRADFTNSNKLKIKGIFWVFVFMDPITKKELNRHKIYSKVSIDANETDTVEFFSHKAPSRLVNVGVLDQQDLKSQYLTHVEIHAIMLSDKTMWKGGNTSDEDCNQLIREVKNGRIFK